MCTDTRTLQPGDLYIALKGPRFNGNLFAAQALDAGASAVIVDEDIHSLGGGVEDARQAAQPGRAALAALAENPRVIRVEDGLRTLQDLARHHRRQWNFPVFALTGSNGKTTTKELLAAVLSRRFEVGFTRGNLNNHIGVPMTLLSMPPESNFAVVEMGANAQGEIAGLCAIAEPDAGLITNIGDAHLEGFGGRAGVKKGKGELFDFLRQRGGQIFCWSDSADLMELALGAQHKLSYGSGPGVALRVRALSSGVFAAAELSFTPPFERASLEVHSQLVGAYNVPNLAAAACVGAWYGVPPEEIKAALQEYRPANQRSEWRAMGSNWLYLDAYNANPSSMRVALESLAQMRDVPRADSDTGSVRAAQAPGAPEPGAQASGADRRAASGSTLRRGAVLGDMRELGEFSREAHQQIADLAASLGLDLLVFIGPDFGAVRLPDGAQHFADAAGASGWLREQRVNNYVLLLKGSRGIGVERVMDALV